MRKILSLIGIIAMSATTVVPVVACKTKESNKPAIPSSLIVNEQVNKWAQESSVIAKSLLISKEQNINTNNLLNYTLQSNSNNINHDVTNTTDGNSYQDFINDWGYNNTITSNFAENDFINNNASTAADNFKTIKNTIAEIKTFLPSLSTVVPPELVVKYLSSNKEKIIPTLIKLFKDASIDMGSVGILLDSLKGFNPKEDLKIGEKNYYNDGDGDIAKSIEVTVLGPHGNDGWLFNSNYQQKSEAATTSEVTTNLFTKENIKKITSWDSFYIAKTSIEINQLYKTANNSFLGAALNGALTYNSQQQVNGIDTNKLLVIIEPLIKDPIKLLSLLIPVIKWQELGFPPTATIKKIIDGSTPTNIDEGILNIKDVIKNVENLIASPEKFADFFINLLSANDKNQGLFSDVVINTTIDKNPTTFTEAMANSKLFHDDIKNKLKQAFSMISSFLKSFTINDWLEAIIKTFTTDTNLDIDFIDLSNKLTAITNSKGLIDAVNLIKGKDTIDDTTWDQILASLGVKEKTFASNTTLGMILELLKTYEPTIETILTNINSTIDNYIYTPAEKIVDFNNSTKSWTTTVDHWTYDSETNQSTIFYALQKENNIYNITVVINGDAKEAITTNKSKIWIKEMTKKS